MSEAAPSSPSAKRRVTAQDRADRRIRIFARLQEGWSYEAIAQEEGLSRERVRQIVSEIMTGRTIDPRRDHTLLQIARLDPALRLAAQQVAAGDLRAVDRLLRVLDQLDKYHGAAAAMGRTPGANPAYEELLAKLSRMAARRDAAAAEKAPSGTGEGTRDEPAEGEQGGGAGDEVSKFFPSHGVHRDRTGQG